MGNSPKNTNAFTRNWRHVAPSLLRNELTHELIEQHYLSFANPEEQLLGTQLLAKRIRLHHPHIVKLIYYAPESQPCSCSPLDKPYRTQLYTEYPGDCLIGFMRVNQLPLKSRGCPCMSLMQGAMYLQKYYGSFEIFEDRVFFDLQQLHEKQPSFKIWVHADKGQCQPQKSCSQSQMVQNLVQLYSYLRVNGFCSTWRGESLQAMTALTKLSQLKNELIREHNFDLQEDARRKKSFSAVESKNKINLDEDKHIESNEIRVYNKPISMPHQAVSTHQGSYSMPMNSNSKKVTFNQNIPDAKKKISLEVVPKKIDVQPFKLSQGATSTQATLQPIPTPKAFNQFPLQNKGTIKQNNQRVNFNYMSVDSYVDKKNGQTFKHEGNLIKYHDQSYTRQRVVSNIDQNFKKIQVDPIKQRIEIQQNNKFTNNIELKHAQLPFKSKLEEPLSQKIKQPTQNFLVSNPPQSFSTNPQNKISNSQPSVYITHPSVTNSEQTIVQQIIIPINQRNQIQINESIPVPDQQAFTALQMQLPLKKNSQKYLPSHLPTTSRSPNKGKEGTSIKPISQISQAIDSKGGHIKGNKIIYPEHLFSSRKSSRKPSHPNIASKNQKLERYVKEIRQYEETIRQRLSSSTGNKKYKGFSQNYEIKVKPETRSDKPGEFKETKSIYNDSEYRPMQGSLQSLGVEPNQWQEADEIRKKRKQQNLNQYQSQERKYQKDKEQYQKQLKMMYMRQKIQQRQHMKQVEQQQEKEKQFQIDRLRKIAFEEKKKIEAEMDIEKQQKIELQKDLECERKHIQNQMNDLLRQNAMKDQYRSIREKVKQKKETFAQLKAEAAKILEDCLY